MLENAFRVTNPAMIAAIEAEGFAPLARFGASSFYPPDAVSTMHAKLALGIPREAAPAFVESGELNAAYDADDDDQGDEADEAGETHVYSLPHLAAAVHLSEDEVAAVIEAAGIEPICTLDDAVPLFPSEAVHALADALENCGEC